MIIYIIYHTEITNTGYKTIIDKGFLTFNKALKYIYNMDHTDHTDHTIHMDDIQEDKPIYINRKIYIIEKMVIN